MAIECKNLTNGLRISTNGKYFACCHTFDAPFKDENGVHLFAHKTTIEEALNSHSRKEMIRDFENDIRHPACKVCWDAEDAGFQSKRQRDNTAFERVPNKNKEDIYFLELNLGNTCNLACRICHISSSSKWRSYHTVNDPSLTEQQIDHYAKEFSRPFVDTSLIWDELFELLPKVKQIDVYGGEPMLMRKQWELLRHCVDNGYAEDQRMSFNTNGTIITEEYIKILSSFSYCRIGFSIDGVGDKFHYLRYPGNWESVDNNIKLWQEKTKHLPWHRMLFELACTVSLLNVMYIFEVVDYVIENNIKLHMSFVYTPPHLSITTLPKEIKERILAYLEPQLEKRLAKVEELKKNNYINDYDHQMECYRQAKKVISTIKLPNKPNPYQWSEFRRHTLAQDKLRGQNFAETFPEAEAIYGLYSKSEAEFNKYENKQLI